MHYQHHFFAILRIFVVYFLRITTYVDAHTSRMRGNFMSVLNGKVAIVSGGSDGIGRAIALKLANEGAHVVICARDETKLSATKDAISQTGGACEYRIQDMNDAEGYARMIETVAAAKGLHILVNNAPHVGFGMISDTGL